MISALATIHYVRSDGWKDGRPTETGRGEEGGRVGDKKHTAHLCPSAPTDRPSVRSTQSSLLAIFCVSHSALYNWSSALNMNVISIFQDTDFTII